MTRSTQSRHPLINLSNDPRKEVANIEVASALIEIFVEVHLPTQVCVRHELNARRVAVI